MSIGVQMLRFGVLFSESRTSLTPTVFVAGVGHRGSRSLGVRGWVKSTLRIIIGIRLLGWVRVIVRVCLLQIRMFGGSISLCATCDSVLRPLWTTRMMTFVVRSWFSRLVRNCVAPTEARLLLHRLFVTSSVLICLVRYRLMTVISVRCAVALTRLVIRGVCSVSDCRGSLRRRLVVRMK